MTHTLRDVYQSVTNKIIEALETGTPPWVHPWHSGAGDWRPANLSSGRRYSGVNVLLLNMTAMESGYGINRWLTYSQARALGAHVRKGEQGAEVVFFKMHEVGAGPSEAGGPDDRKIIPLLRSFTVFNADQIDDLPTALMPAPVVVHEWQACEAAEVILASSGANIRHGGTKAFYSPAEDRIQLPDRSAFATATGYYQVALHELTHWTSAESRCNRPLLGRQNISAYALEELVAELGSAFLTDSCGMPGVLQHAGYIESWLTALRNDKKVIFTAASMAQKAADYLTGQPVDAVKAVAEVTA